MSRVLPIFWISTFCSPFVSGPVRSSSGRSCSRTTCSGSSATARPRLTSNTCPTNRLPDECSETGTTGWRITTERDCLDKIVDKPNAERRPASARRLVCGAGEGRRRNRAGETMSTRCQLRFVQCIERETTPDLSTSECRIAQVYRHADGYPEGVLRILSQLNRLQNRTRTARGPDCTAAQLILLDKLRTMRLYLDREQGQNIRADDPSEVLDSANMEHLDQPLFLLGHGIENPTTGIHGDEEYLYVVELPAANENGSPGGWTIWVSEHCGFPRLDGLTGEAFERATWQFEGSLARAHEQFLGDTR